MHTQRLPALRPIGSSLGLLKYLSSSTNNRIPSLQIDAWSASSYRAAAVVTSSHIVTTYRHSLGVDAGPHDGLGGAEHLARAYDAGAAPRQCAPRWRCSSSRSDLKPGEHVWACARPFGLRRQHVRRPFQRLDKHVDVLLTSSPGLQHASQRVPRGRAPDRAVLEARGGH